ncbi:hypothetical protein ES332_D01G239100v1 [Gossypium tomentosum]|uniref:Uncharacterized protein n=1 Tax=Gossypium tomentosum TaxID=34277 RepID=A0A5D2MCU2_GOSTO|nr:hypothetical protein ES332_D01G239100v1 [Gossypium tomentosum]
MVVTSFLRSSWRPYFLINCSLKMNLRLLKMILDPQNIHRLKDSRFPLNILDKIVSVLQLYIITDGGWRIRSKGKHQIW